MHDVRLLFDTDLAQAQEYELVKIAELLRAPDGQGAVLSPRYIPPTLAVHASPVLTRLLKAVRDQLTAKGREFAEYQQQCGNPPSAMGPRETVALVMRQTLNRYIPLVQHYLVVYLSAADNSKCHGYVLATYGTRFHGQQAAVAPIVRVLACLAAG